jgi:hypothetical protein
MDPDPGGSKTYGSYGPGSATLQKSQRDLLTCSEIGSDLSYTIGNKLFARNPVIPCLRQPQCDPRCCRLGTCKNTTCSHSIQVF